MWYPLDAPLRADKTVAVLQGRQPAIVENLGDQRRILRKARHKGRGRGGGNIPTSFRHKNLVTRIVRRLERKSNEKLIFRSKGYDTIARMTRIVFMGTPEFAVPVLQALVEHYNVVAVYTRADKPSGRGKQVVVSPVKHFALQHNLPVGTAALSAAWQ